MFSKAQDALEGVVLSVGIYHKGKKLPASPHCPDMKTQLVIPEGEVI